MPDILRVTTPLVNKNQPVLPKPGVDPTHPFDIQDSSRVIQAHNQSEIQKQNSGMLEGGEAPALLLNLLKDPAVTVSYLKNIFLLEEIFRLLPANNKTVTPEIEQLFQALIMRSDGIQSEMVRQEHASTMFKGALFDFLRQTSDTYRSTPEVQMAIATLLKSINNFLCKDDILDAVANSLDFLKSNLSSSKNLSAQLNNLISQFRRSDAPQHFSSLKDQTLALLKDVENSILFSSKLSKVLSITVYNLSRYNDNLDFLNESAYRLRQLLPVTLRQQYAPLIEQLITALKSGPEATRALMQTEQDLQNSTVMDSLTALVAQQSDNESLSASDSAKINKILHSLLSSPCNFTPLLHFIVPVLHDNIRAFAEIWINPESDEKDMPEGIKEGRHFLLVIDVESIGRFEAELFVYGQTIDFALFCPPGYEGKYEGMMKSLPTALEGTPYHLGHTRLEPLERSRSLMDVFKSLPYKRVGIDVKL